uniref:Glucuronosyltransferase n=1 Tax=Neobodo designis TaxID=312471 RepID=A0A7S1PNL2_NEODS|mmetsp:Transcript_13404/g.41700  ORF Transcript_13404/g.41700 Transcript_13404/m.41700 type:complete len:526 (+) Transcript_13404:29-1606(+)
MRAAAVAVALIAVIAAPAANALHAGFLAMPELGHLYPLAAVAHAFVGLSEDNRVTMLTYSLGMKDCQRAIAGAPRVECQPFTDHGFDDFDEKFFEDFVTKPALETLGFIGEKGVELQINVSDAVVAAFKKEPRYDVILADFAHVEVAIMAAEVTETPLAVLWPLVLQLPAVARDPRIPQLGLALSIDMPWWQQMLNFAFSRLGTVMMWKKSAPFEALRAKLGLPASNILAPYRNHLVITPSVFGLDIPQPLCPNVVPAGMLQPPTAHAADVTIDADWQQWLDGCAKLGGIVYANMGSLGRLPPSWVAMFDAALRNTSRAAGGRRCVLWKLQERQQVGLVAFGDGTHTNTERVTGWLPFSPRTLLEQRRISVFVTHCGDTSVYETVQYGAAFVGYALFADQPDMCARVADAKLGVALDKMSAGSEELHAAVATALAMEADARVRMATLRMVSQLQGESRRAAEALAMTAEFPQLMVDTATDVWTGMEVDATLGFSVALCLVFSGLWSCMSWLLCCGRRRAPRATSK